MAQVNIGIAGFGGWPREAYAPALRDMPEVNVAGVAARSLATRQVATETFGPSLKTFEGWRDLLADDSIDAVMLALPGHLHAEALIAAIGSGKHVFFEPPIGLATDEIRAAIDAAARAGTVVQADLELRYLPAIALLRKHMATGDIGQPLVAEMRLWCSWMYGGGPWLDEAEPLGFFPWLGWWYLDVLDCVFAAMPTRATATCGYAMNRTLSDFGNAALEYEGGGVGLFDYNLLATEERLVELHVSGTEGEFVADLWTGACRFRKRDGQWQEEDAPCAQPAAGFAGMRESIATFVAAVGEGKPVPGNLEIIRRVNAASLACHQSEKEKTTVKLPVAGM